MTEKMRQRMHFLLKVIRIQWLAILILLVAFIIALVSACSIKANAVHTNEPESTPTTSIEESLPIVLPKPELINAGAYKLTAYCPCVKCCGIWSKAHASRKDTNYIQKTASGTIPTDGRTIAVDISVIPFGTIVVINDHEYIAEDRGGAVKGNKIDIFFANHKDALNFGVQHKIIYIKKGEK